jgi:hypothetical protein
MHIAIVVPILVAGPVLLYTERLTFADLIAAGKQVRALGDGASLTGAAG